MKNESYGNVLPHCCVCSLLLLLLCVFVVVAFCNLLAASRLFVCICVCACVCVFCACLCVTYPVCCLSVPVCAACGCCLWWVWCDAVCCCCCSCFYWDKCELFFFLFSLSFPLCSLFCCLCVLLQHNSCSFVSQMIFWFLRVACVRRPSPSRPGWLAACLCVRVCTVCQKGTGQGNNFHTFTLCV